MVFYISYFVLVSIISIGDRYNTDKGKWEKLDLW